MVVDVAEVLQREQIRSDRPQRDPLTATQTGLHPRTLSPVARSYVVSGSGIRSEVSAAFHFPGDQRMHVGNLELNSYKSQEAEIHINTCLLYKNQVPSN